MNISKENLKQALVTSIEVFEELKAEKKVMMVPVEEIIRAAISIYIQCSRNGNGNGYGNGYEKKEPAPMMVNFGKHKGKTMEELVKFDRSYVSWIANKSEIEKFRVEAKRVLDANPIQTVKVTIPKPKAYQK